MLNMKEWLISSVEIFFLSKQQSLHGILSGNYMQINSCFNSNLKYRVNEKIMFALNNCDIIFITLFRGIKVFVLVMRFEIFAVIIVQGWQCGWF
jgi:hypothetical protein